MPRGQSHLGRENHSHGIRRLRAVCYRDVQDRRSSGAKLPFPVAFVWQEHRGAEGQGAKVAREGPVTYDKLEQRRARVKCH
jgi:hypothetical protein